MIRTFQFAWEITDQFSRDQECVYQLPKPASLKIWLKMIIWLFTVGRWVSGVSLLSAVHRDNLWGPRGGDAALNADKSQEPVEAKMGTSL